MSESLRDLLLALFTLVVSLFSTRAMRRVFSRFRSREKKEGKDLIYRHYPRHKKPLGGGVAILLALAAGVLAAEAALWLWPYPGKPHLTRHVAQMLWVFLAGGAAFAAIGFIDDWRKVNAARGLSEAAKLGLQAVAAILLTVLVLLVREVPPQPATAIFLPFIGWVPLLWGFLLFAPLVIIGTANAVNLIDGLDGLSGTTLLVSFLGALLLATLLQHPHLPAVAPALAIAAILGFVLFNLPPAKIIMGDTGALGLGAALGVLALLSGSEWLLLLLGATFVLTTISVMLQMTVIKVFRGPIKLLRHQTTEIFRPFLCTPLHHHFQWLGWGPWVILALYAGVGLASVLCALLAFALAGTPPGGWIWVLGLLVQVAFLVFAAVQKTVQANYFLGLETPDGARERILALYKGLPVEVLGVRWYTPIEYSEITEDMVNDIAAESLLWRNISEIEARAALGKIYHAHKKFDKAAEQWEQIPLRNLLIRENLVLQLGDIYMKGEQLLRAVKLLEQLPSSRLAQLPGMPETIQAVKVRIGNMAGKLYHLAREHAATLRHYLDRGGHTPAAEELALLLKELEAALHFTQDLRDLLAYEQHKAEGLGELGDGPDLYRRMDAILAVRRDELHETLLWVQALAAPEADAGARTPLDELAATLGVTPPELGRALEVSAPPAVRAFTQVSKPSRNTLFRIALEAPRGPLPESLVAKCYGEEHVTFFSACYRRERGVLQILSEAGAPVPRVLGGYLGSHKAVLFLDDLGMQDLAGVLAALPADDRAGRLALLRRGLQTLVTLYTRALPVLPRLEREIRKIVKEVLTPEYFVNTTSIALNRILALKRRQLTAGERGRLEAALRPAISAVLDAPKAFIHFEFTPGNLQMVDSHVLAVDFEQSTLGPAAFDVASLLFAPEADLSDTEISGLLDEYHDLLPTDAHALLAVPPATLEAAAILKTIFYAGSAANFYRKYEASARLDAMEWYLRTAERLIPRLPDAADMAALLEAGWPSEMRSAR
jgi:phospho-N-acetylmuramoyl-pentapeptide-transferase